LVPIPKRSAYPASDLDVVVVDSLKALDPNRPIREGGDQLPPPSGLEAAALARIGATPGMRLACQLRPDADISIMPLLAPDAGALEGSLRGGLEGSERLITVVFVDMRGSTSLGESKLPYDVLFILNRFFQEMSKAVAATNGHCLPATG
jgi:adenylate cyclase